MKSILIAIVVLWSGLAFAIDVKQVPNPRDAGGWVTDLAGVIPSTEETRINERIERIYKERGVEIAVVTVDSVNAATPKDFATKLFNLWKIGSKSRDDGLLILLVQGERRLEMETGYGMEVVLPDRWLKSMQQDLMIPQFKRGDFGAGVAAGVDASIDRIRVYYDNGGQIDSAYDGGDGGGSSNWILLLVLGAGGAASVKVGANRLRRARDAKCPVCTLPGTLLSELEEDEHLTEGQTLEEGIGSVNYDVYWCDSCESANVVGRKRWISSYTECQNCWHKTASASSITLSHPTEFSTGTQEVTVGCANCDHTSSHILTIPRRVRSSSSSSFGGGGGSSGGGGSFGGGSSGGGGAGSSW